MAMHAKCRITIDNRGTSNGLDGDGIAWSIEDVSDDRVCEGCGVNRLKNAWCTGTRVRCGHCVDYGASRPHRVH